MKTKPAWKPGVLVAELGYKEERLPAEALPLMLKRILVPTDFSEWSKKALHYALAFVEQSQADLVLWHVVELYPIDYLVGVESTLESNAYLREQAQERLQQLSRHYASASRVRAETVVTFGPPFHEIAQVAQERGVDIIILTTHGFTGLKHVQLGSTAERVVRHAPCPVLVVREQEREFVQLDPDKPVPHGLRMRDHSHRTRAATGVHRSVESIRQKQAA